MVEMAVLLARCDRDECGAVLLIDSGRSCLC